MPPKLVDRSRPNDELPNFNKVYTASTTSPIQPLFPPNKAVIPPAATQQPQPQPPVEATTTTAQPQSTQQPPALPSGQQTIQRYFKPAAQQATQQPQQSQATNTSTDQAHQLAATEVVQIHKALVKEIEELTATNKELTYNANILKTRVTQLEMERGALQDKYVCSS